MDFWCFFVLCGVILTGSCFFMRRAILAALGQKYDQYLDFAQQDAHEFLRILLDAMRMEEQDVSLSLPFFFSFFLVFLFLPAALDDYGAAALSMSSPYLNDIPHVISFRLPQFLSFSYFISDLLLSSLSDPV